MARLPEPGGDVGDWGEILNEFLRQEHNDDGSLKETGSLASKADSSAVSQVESNVATILGRHEILLHDDFTRYQPGPIHSLSPIIGPAWFASGVNIPQVVNGGVTSSGSGYIFAQLENSAHYMEATFTLDSSVANSSSGTLSWCNNPAGLSDILHLTYGYRGMYLTARHDAGAFQDVGQGDWNIPLLCDGTTEYRIGMYVRENACTVIGPHGEMFTWTSGLIPALAAQSGLFWQAGPGHVLTSARAIRRLDDYRPEAVPSFLDLAVMADIVGHLRQLSGSPNTHWETMIGQQNSGRPGVRFGPSKVRTVLMADVSVGATQIVTPTPLNSGATVQIGAEADAETVVILGNPSPLPGAGYPYTHSLTSPTTKAHHAGDYVSATSYTAGTLTYEKFDPVWPFQLSHSLRISGNVGVGSNQVLGSRRTGWSAMTGTAERTAFDTSSATTEAIARRLKALIDDLRAHGLIGD
jgi:hypothetical protein